MLHGGTMDRVQSAKHMKTIHILANRANFESCMFVDCGRKPEHPVKTHKRNRRACTLDTKKLPDHYLHFNQHSCCEATMLNSTTLCYTNQLKKSRSVLI